MQTVAAHGSRAAEIFPVFILACGDDGKRKPFHVVHCMAAGCTETLRLAPGKSSRLPPEAVAKFALQKGWHADKGGYALCPAHRPGANGKSNMPPRQKVAAFNAIRTRQMAAAGNGNAAHPPPPCTSRKAKMTRGRLATLRTMRDAGRPLTSRQIADLLHEPPNVVTHRLAVMVRDGLAVRHGAKRPFLFSLPDQKESHAMPLESATIAPLNGGGTSPEPRQPTLAQNRAVHDFLDSHYDPDAGRWTDDWSDETAAAKLKFPRAWVAKVRQDFFGPDVSEASDRAAATLNELLADAMRLKDLHLSLAAQAETLERGCRKALGIDRL